VAPSELWKHEREVREQFEMGKDGGKKRVELFDPGYEIREE